MLPLLKRKCTADEVFDFKAQGLSDILISNDYIEIFFDLTVKEVTAQLIREVAYLILIILLNSA